MLNKIKTWWSKNRPHRRRGYQAAKINRLTNDWTTSSLSSDEEIKAGLKIIRARSRDLTMNNDYGKKFMSMLASNVCGPQGIRLQARVENDAAAEKKIEEAWTTWGRMQNASIEKNQTFIDLQRLFIQTVARDGEILVRKVQGADNPFKFALQVIEPEFLDEQYNIDKLPNGNRIKMGVEVNPFGVPQAYHIFTRYPAGYGTAGQKRIRVPAAEIIHAFIIERAGQTRGVPWTATALRRLNMLGHYEQSELVASRVGAAKMGFFTNEAPTGFPYDDKDDDGNLINEVAPGKFETLPPGYDFKAFDIDHPNTGFENFVKSILRGAAAGLNVSYNSLANNLESTSYSSMRHGVLEERDAWMLIQQWMIDHFHQLVYENWLYMALATQQLKLPIGKYDVWSAPRWRPRRWAWIDPLKDMNANVIAIGKGLKSRTDVAAEQGQDIEDVFARLAAEEKMAAALGLNITGEKEKVKS